jgi:hypothetical protein
MSTATDLTKLAPMASEVLAVLPCTASEDTTDFTDHLVNTVTGEAACAVCSTVQVLEAADIETLLEDA